MSESSGAGYDAGTWYSVLTEARSADDEPGVQAGNVLDGMLDALADAAQPWEGVAGASERSWSVRLSVQAGDAVAAAAQGARLAQQAAQEAGLPAWPVVRLEASTEQVLDEDNRRPVPEVVSAQAAADLLGISRQRLHQLRAEHPIFPAPVYELPTGPLWVRSVVEGFGADWDRTPGRHVGSAARG